MHIWTFWIAFAISFFFMLARGVYCLMWKRINTQNMDKRLTSCNTVNTLNKNPSATWLMGTTIDACWPMRRAKNPFSQNITLTLILISIFFTLPGQLLALFPVITSTSSTLYYSHVLQILIREDHQLQLLNGKTLICVLFKSNIEIKLIK